ncbi:MAG TPA: winged helix-turn-helix domain-containing protein, partial [Rhodanobacteraceae bacterium]|nr:winged helix-turn-helix domain-containing protein [Rhodanobacteraceae bacterium]
MTKNETASGWIVFDQIEIDLAGRRLFVAGAEMPLEPKAFAVLALLASNPGQALTRDDILDSVWGHRHVTPGVLNRVITLLRQALGESAEATQYVHTLHGVGYRFDAATQVVASRRAAGPERGGDDASPAAQGPVSAARAMRDADEESAAESELPAASMPTTASAATAATASKPARQRLAALAVLLACVLIGAIYLLVPRSPRAPSGASPTLVVLPLRPVGAAQDENVFAEGLSEELITRLARIDGLHLISQTSAALARTDQLDLNQMSERLHVTHALEGSLRQAGQQLRIDLRLIEIPAGRTLWAQDYDRSLADVFAIQSEIAQSVATTLTLKLGLQRTPVETDPQLFREYLELRRRPLDNPGVGEYAKTIELLRAFAARAPDYARAHGLLARVLLQELRVSLATPADHAEAAREAARALELDPDQVEAHTALATLACRAADWTKCMNGFRHVLTLAPTETVLRSTYSRWLVATGYLDEALRQSDIAVASDPLNYTAIFYRARVLDTLGRHDEA